MIRASIGHGFETVDLFSCWDEVCVLRLVLDLAPFTALKEFLFKPFADALFEFWEAPDFKPLVPLADLKPLLPLAERLLLLPAFFPVLPLDERAVLLFFFFDYEAVDFPVVEALFLDFWASTFSDKVKLKNSVANTINFRDIIFPFSQ